VNAERPVLIAGAGPVGLTAALTLARRGVPVVVLESGAELSSESRASTFHPPTLEMLDDLGLTDGLIEIGLIADRYQHRDRREGLVAEFDLGVLREDTRFPFRVQCEQHRYTPLALAALERTGGAEVRFGHAVADLEQSAGEVRATVETPFGTEHFAGSHMVGADGARSVVRRACQIEFEGMTYAERYLVLTTEDDFREAIPDIAHVNYVSDPEEFVVLLRLPDVWRAMFPVAPELSAEEAFEDAAVERRLQGVAERPGGYTVQHRTLYHVHQRVASSFRSRRVLLAGDAAHINNPLGGMGMNAGVHDAFELGRRLAAVWHGEAGDEQLDLYDRHRRETATGYVRAMSHRNFESIRRASPEDRRRDQEELRRTAADPEAARRYLLRSTLIESLWRTGGLPAAGSGKAFQ
jgi:3-(3-hydroxy-phenyl)propionate hydroxylase